MKRIVESIGLVALICFSFMYTDKVMEVISEKDSLYIEIDSQKDKYKIEAVDGIIDNNTLIPGIKGREININESYKNMRELGIFREDMIIYKDIYPKNLISNNYDKYVISGNNTKREISLIFIILNDNNLDNLLKIIDEYEIKVNLFVDYNYLTENINKLINNNLMIYSYGDKGIYNHDNIFLSRNIIKSKTGNDRFYCFYDNIKETLDICDKEGITTIKPTVNTINNPYNELKSNLKNGSIINLNLNSELIKQLPSIIDFIKGKGLKVVSLNELLSEELNYQE